MYSQLTYTEQQEVNTLIEVIGEADIEMLVNKVHALYPDAPATVAKDHIQNMVATIIARHQDTAQDFIDEDLIPILVQVLIHFIGWCKYISSGDRIPNECITDILTIARAAIHDDWHELITKNMACIPSLVRSTQGGKNVSTALFIAIINTAFDYAIWG